MRDISINIKKARIKTFFVELKDDLPDVTATIGLFTEGGEKIAEYSISTSAWDEKKKFDVNPVLIRNILNIAHELERVVTEHCKMRQMFLPERGDE